MPSDEFAKFGGRSLSGKEMDEFAKFGGKALEVPKAPNLGKEALRQIGRVGRAGATGIAGIADIPNLAALGLHAAGLKEEPTFYEPIAGRTQQAIDTLTGGKLKPQNKAEEYMDVIGEGLAPLALAPLTGGASLTGIAARGIASKAAPGLLKKGAQKLAQAGSKPYALTGANVAGNVGSSAALKAYLDEYKDDPNLAAALAAGLAGGAAGRGLYKLRNPANALAGGIGKVTGFSPEKYKQNVEAGLPVSVASVAKGKAPSYMEMIASKLPGSMEPLEDFYKKREAALARNLGIQTPEDLEGTVRNIPKHLAKKGAEKYHERASNIYEKRGEKFKPREEAAITNKETVDVSDIIGKLESERSLHLTEGARRRFDKTPDGILLKELRESIPGTPDTSLFESLKKQGYPPELVQKIIKSETAKVPQKIGLYDLNKLREKALQESIQLKTPLGGGTPESAAAARRSEMLGGKRHQFMEEIGTPSEIHHARQARKFWAQYRNEKNGMAHYVEKLTGADTDAEAFKKLLGANANYINVARQGLTKTERPKLMEAMISKLGERQGRFSINTAYTGFSRLEEPVKQEFLKTFPTKSARKNFEDTIQMIGENKRLMEKLENTSKTAHSKEMIDLMKRYGAAATAAATGYGVMPLTGLLATYGGLKYGAKLWTNQNFLKRMNDTLTAKTQKGQLNNLDLMFKSLNQVGRQTHSINNSSK